MEVDQKLTKLVGWLKNKIKKIIIFTHTRYLKDIENKKMQHVASKLLKMWKDYNTMYCTMNSMY